MKIISYYTKNTPYEQETRRLQQSLAKLNLEPLIIAVASRGSWQKNTHLKPQIILHALDSLLCEPILYVDADATFHRIPDADWSEYTWGAHIMDKAFWGQNITRRTHSLMSGTLYFANNRYARNILRQWAKLNQRFPDVWDQRNLEKLWQSNPARFINLPVEYCAIDKTMRGIKNPVIRHHQASRRLKGKIC